MVYGSMGGMGGIVGMVYVHLVVYLYLSQIGHGDLYSFIWCLYPPSGSLQIVKMNLWSAARRLYDTSLFIFEPNWRR